jgi:type I restriction enzyme S subunit
MEQFIIGKSWPTVTLADAFSLQMGKTPSRDVPEYWNSPDYRWISIADLSNYGNFTGDTKEKISQSAVDNTGIRPVPKGTVIMSFKLTIGRTAITSEDIYTNEAIMAFLPKRTDIDIDFLRLYLSIKNWTEDAKQAVKGVTLNKQSIGAAEIVIPPIDDQRKFAAFARQSDKSKYNASQVMRLKK